jgi:putative isomerase
MPRGNQERKLMSTFAENQRLLLDVALKHAAEMFHEADGCLAHPYLDPGGPYSRTLWDWDSFWASRALLGIAGKIRDRTSAEEFRRKVLYYAKGAIKNFFLHQGADGSLPILISDKDPDWFDSVSNPANNMAKPVQGQFLLLLDKFGALDDDEKTLFLESLAKAVNCRKQRYQHEASGLYVWANDVAIGVDDDPSTWGRPPFSSANIFLNCLMYQDLVAAAEFAGASDNGSYREKFKQEAGLLKESIRRFCWDSRDGMYYSVDVQCRQNLSEHRIFGTLNINLKPFWHCMPLKVMNWVSIMPLWCGIADKEQAVEMIDKNLLNPARLWTPYGIRSLSADEKMYSPDIARGNPSNWLGPVWIIACYMAWCGLNNYGYDDKASELAQNVVKMLADDYRSNGLLHEYYHPETGKGICGPGFLNWNLLACIME